MTEARKILLRAWAAHNDRALEVHGTEEAITARHEANRIADDLGDLSQEDWGVIRNAQREYQVAPSARRTSSRLVRSGR